MSSWGLRAKCMTEKGFLVTVDPGKLKGEDRAIIKVMAWKDTDNGLHKTRQG